MTRHYKKLLSSLRDKLEAKWTEAGDNCQDDLICAFNDLDRASENEYKKEIATLKRYDSNIKEYKQAIENIKKQIKKEESNKEYFLSYYTTCL